jgi:hypothetical protein
MVKLTIPEDVCDEVDESSDVLIDPDREYDVDVVIEQADDGSYSLEQCLVYYIDIDSDDYVDILNHLSSLDKEDIIEKVLDKEEYESI